MASPLVTAVYLLQRWMSLSPLQRILTALSRYPQLIPRSDEEHASVTSLNHLDLSSHRSGTVQQQTSLARVRCVPHIA